MASDLPSREDLKEWSTWDLGNIEAALLALVERCLPVVEAMSNRYEEWDNAGVHHWACHDCEERGHYRGKPVEGQQHDCPSQWAWEILREVDRG